VVLKLSKGLLIPALALPAIITALPPSELRDDLLLLWFSLTPISIFVYSSRTWRLQRWKLGVLGGLEILFFFGIWWFVFLVVGENCYPGQLLCDSRLLLLTPPVLSIVVGWFLGKLRTRTIHSLTTPKEAEMKTTLRTKQNRPEPGER
jgi:hypothetical protein